MEVIRIPPEGMERAEILVQNVEWQDPGLLWPFRARFHRDDHIVIEGEARKADDAEIHLDWKLCGGKGVYRPPSPCPSWTDTEPDAETAARGEREPGAQASSPLQGCDYPETCALNPEDREFCTAHGDPQGKLPPMIPADRAEQYHEIRRSGILSPLYLFGITRGSADVDYDEILDHLDALKEARGIVQGLAPPDDDKERAEDLMQRIRAQETRLGMTRRLARLVSPTGDLPFDMRDWCVAERHREEKKRAQGRS